jgi:hypothetical protein
MQSLSSAHTGLETVTIERPSALDGQGLPSYDSPVAVLMFVLREQSVVRQANGDEVQAIASMWCGADQPMLPQEQDRLVTSDGLTGIVIARQDGKSLQTGALDMVAVQVREE